MLVTWRGLEAVSFGRGDALLAHTTHDRVSVAALETAARVYHRLLENLAELGTSEREEHGMRWTFDHVHLIASDVNRAVEFYRQMLGAVIVNRGEVSGQPQAWMDLNGTLLILRARRATDELVEGKNTRIDHFGLRVDDLEKAVADLKGKGAKFTVEPTVFNPTTKIAFIEGPDGVRIELLERTGRAGSASAIAPKGI